MKKYAVSLLTAIALTIGIADGYAAPRSWESVKSEQALSEAKVVARGADVEVRVGHGIIYLTSNKPISIKVFTILGQTVVQDHLPAGSSQLIIGTHGVFIVKVGDATFKVAV